jgi:hypothetical protein
MMGSPRFRTALGLLLLVVACKDTQIKNRCQQDSDCGAASAFRCEPSTGTCYCRTDGACKTSEFCNPAGFCQDRAGCEKNSDCIDPGHFCDTSTGGCLPKGRCTMDLHCPLGQVCDAAKTTCVEGCKSHGDCSGVSCRCGTAACECSGTTPEERAKCQVGVCDPYFCADSSYCKFGELCGVRPDAGSDIAQCYTDFDPDYRPYCSNCTYGGGLDVCGRGANYCLVDTVHAGNSFCGADCSEGQACPRGYKCSDVIVVFSRWSCTRDNPSCPGNPALPCSGDSDCRRGGKCLKAAGEPTGMCSGACAIDPEETVGFCSCQVDEDCAQQSCTAGECSISRKSCTVDADCKTIRCVDHQGSGGCFVGQNCAPADGLTCLEVQ